MAYTRKVKKKKNDLQSFVKVAPDHQGKTAFFPVSWPYPKKSAAIHFKIRMYCSRIFYFNDPSWRIMVDCTDFKYWF